MVFFMKDHFSALFDSASRDIFDEFFERTGEISGVIVSRSGDTITVEVDVPGARPGQVEVQLDSSNGTTTAVGVNYKRGETKITRRFKLTGVIDRERVVGQLADGVLKLTLGVVTSGKVTTVRF